MTRDLTTGTPSGQILRFGIPLLFGNLFQQLYNVVDTAIVGKTLGENALAAVGSTGSVNFLVVGFCSGVCGGFAIPVAQQFGRRDEGELRRYVTGGAWLSLIFALALTLATVLGCGGILRGMNTPADVFDRAHCYILTIFAGLPAYFLFNFCAGVLRSLGDSRTPVLCLVGSSLVNIGLDVLFILCFRLDVFGAALATVLSQALAGLGCLLRLCLGFPELRMERRDWAWDRGRMKTLCVMGLPMGLQYSVTAIGSIMLQASVNALGTGYVAAVTAASKVSLFLTCPFDAMGATMATYGGQNVGARKFQRLHQGLRACMALGAVYAAAALGVIALFWQPLVMLFLNADSAALLPLCREYLLINGAFYFALALINIFRFLIQGMGFSPLATLAGGFELAARAGFSLLVPMFGYSAACAASPAAWVLADLFLVPAYFHCVRLLQGGPTDRGRRLRRRLA